MTTKEHISGKGRITIDDIAKGVSYNQEPFSQAKKFEVIVPDVPSQQKFFDVNNYTHKYLEKPKRTPFIDSEDPYCIKSKKPENPAATQPIPQPQESEKKEEPMRPSSAKKEEKPAAQKIERPKTGTRRIRNRSGIPEKVGIYHPGELYNPQKADANDPYSKANPFAGSKYHNMLSALHLGGNSTLGDVLKNSDETMKKLRETLKSQNDRRFLKEKSLPPVPERRINPIVANTYVPGNVAKRATNISHGKLTNGGFSRTSYGGFYQH